MSAEVLHPMTVHFPIALLLTALLFETLALFFRNGLLHRISFWNLVLGMWGGLVSVITGGIAAGNTVHVSSRSYQIQRWHELVGYGAFTLAAIVCSWHLAAGEKMRSSSRWAAWGLLGITCGVTALAGHLGGRLVYEFNVGH